MVSIGNGNRFSLCRQVAKLARKMHKPNTRMEDTLRASTELCVKIPSSHPSPNEVQGEGETKLT